MNLKGTPQLDCFSPVTVRSGKAKDQNLPKVKLPGKKYTEELKIDAWGEIIIG